MRSESSRTHPPSSPTAEKRSDEMHRRHSARRTPLHDFPQTQGQLAGESPRYAPPGPTASPSSGGSRPRPSRSTNLQGAPHDRSMRGRPMLIFMQ